MRRLRREASLVRPLQHRGLLRIYDVGETAEGHVFLTSELVRGEPLARRLERGPLPVEEALRIATALLEALGHLHAHGVLHRDVKPSNVLLAEDGGIKLADFGLALSLDGPETRLTADQAMLGTLEYLSPEQALGEPTRPESDLFSLGILLFESLAGQLPFAGSSSVGRLVQRLSARPSAPSARNPAVEPWLDAVVLRLLERRPADRYRSAEQALADLARRRSSRPPPPSRRGRIVAAIAAATLTASFLLLRVQPGRGPAAMLVTDAGGNTAALDRSGRALWTTDAIDARRAAVGVALGDRHVVAGFAAEAEGTPGRDRTLLLLDPATGRPIDVHRLDTDYPRSLFPDFGDHYQPTPTAMDLDGDGRRELLVTWTHAYRPSFTALVEPRFGTARWLLAGSGHLRQARLADLDGDGADELLLYGVDEAFGGSVGVAAIRLRASADSSAVSSYPSTTPDLRPPMPSSLLWYALVPRDACGEVSTCLRVDPARRVLGAEGSRSWLLGFGGFPVAARSALDQAARQDRRRRAYADLRHVWTLQLLDRMDEAWQHLEEAARAATEANDPMLLEWLDRSRGRLLAETGRLEEALVWFERLAAKPGLATPVSFEAASAFHRGGALELALAWYQRHLFEAAGLERGLPAPWEPIEGLVLALDELGRLDQAPELLDRIAAAVPAASQDVELYRAYVAWRRGWQAQLPRRQGSPSGVDLASYLELELAAARGERSPTALLAAIDRELGRASLTRAPLRSLRALVLHSLGRIDEARTEAERGLREANAQRGRRLLDRTLLPLIEARARAVGALTTG